MSIGKKLLIAFNLTIIITNIAVVASFSQFRMIDDWYSKTIDYGLPQIVEATDIELLISKQNTALLKFLHGYDLALYDLRTAQKGIEFAFMRLEDYDLNEESKEKLELCYESTQRYQALVDQTIALHRAGKVDDAFLLIDEELSQAARTVSKTTDLLTNSIMKDFQDEKNKVRSFAKIGFIIFCTFLVFSVMGGILIIYLMYRWINSPTNKLDESFILFTMDQLKNYK